MLFIIFYTILRLLLSAYEIGEKSTVRLSITTSIKKVTCDCGTDYNIGKATIKPSTHENEFDIKNASLTLSINNIDCHNPFINKDLQHTLQASTHPTIAVNLKKLIKKKPTQYTALFEITAAGTCKEVQTHFEVINPTSQGFYEVQTTLPISMQAFHIQPKSTLKFIKIEDEVMVLLHLFIKAI